MSNQSRPLFYENLPKKLSYAVRKTPLIAAERRLRCGKAGDWHTAERTIDKIKPPRLI
jgi:hypothetical protein